MARPPGQVPQTVMSDGYHRSSMKYWTVREASVTIGMSLGIPGNPHGADRLSACGTATDPARSGRGRLGLLQRRGNMAARMHEVRTRPNARIDPGAVLWSVPGRERVGRPLLVMMHGWSYDETHLFELAPRMPTDSSSPRCGRPSQKRVGTPGSPAWATRSVIRSRRSRTPWPTP
jgi:hypothetical protein